MKLTSGWSQASRQRCWVIALCLTANLTAATSAVAQAVPGSSIRRAGLARVPNGTPVGQRSGSRDSLTNGAIVGAAIGAATLGVLAAVLCHAYQEEGGASCVPDAVRFGVIGGAIGAGAGLAIDAARSQRGVTVRLTIRF